MNQTPGLSTLPQATMESPISSSTASASALTTQVMEVNPVEPSSEKATLICVILSPSHTFGPSSLGVGLAKDDSFDFPTNGEALKIDNPDHIKTLLSRVTQVQIPSAHASQAILASLQPADTSQSKEAADLESSGHVTTGQIEADTVNSATQTDPQPAPNSQPVPASPPAPTTNPQIVQRPQPPPQKLSKKLFFNGQVIWAPMIELAGDQKANQKPGFFYHPKHGWCSDKGRYAYVVDCNENDMKVAYFWSYGGRDILQFSDGYQQCLIELINFNDRKKQRGPNRPIHLPKNFGYTARNTSKMDIFLLGHAKYDVRAERVDQYPQCLERVISAIMCFSISRYTPMFRNKGDLLEQMLAARLEEGTDVFELLEPFLRSVYPQEDNLADAMKLAVQNHFPEILSVIGGRRTDRPPLEGRITYGSSNSQNPLRARDANLPMYNNNGSLHPSSRGIQGTTSSRGVGDSGYVGRGSNGGGKRSNTQSQNGYNSSNANKRPRNGPPGGGRFNGGNSSTYRR